MSEPRRGRVAWFNCQAGVAGDMTLAALVDAGADRDEVMATIAGLGVDGYAVQFERVQRGGIGATWANVVVDGHHHEHGGDQEHGHEGHHRPVGDILALLDTADLPSRVRERARAVFVRLAEVEGAIHGVDAVDVELHEVGALDAIIDVVGVCAGLESLGVDEIRCSPIAVGTGSVRAAHGTMPNPAPATIALLRDAAAPTVGVDATLEVTTPTGAALMTTLASGFGAAGAMTVTAVGYGAGTADPADRANVLQVLVGTPTDAGDVEQVVVLETNVDDVTGEVLGHAVTALLDAGALDAWVTPIVMKKGRPGHLVSALCAPVDAESLRAVLVNETGTLGVRATTAQRWPEAREQLTVVVDGHPIGVKRTGARLKVEFDDAQRAAADLGVAVRVVIERAVAAAHDAG